MDEISKEVLKAGAEIVVGKAYNDLLHPTFKAIGDRIAYAVKNIPFMQYNMDETIKLIEPEMRNVPSECIAAPEPYVAVPALQGIACCIDSEELRGLYAKLLSSAMNTEEKGNVHPAFVEIIRQLTPDEAKLLKAFYNSYYGLESPLIYDLYDVYYTSPDGKWFASKQFCLESGISINEKSLNLNNFKNFFSYLENLERLKLMELESENPLSKEEIESFKIIKQEKTMITKHVKIHKKIRYIDKEISSIYQRGLHFTDFGLTFCSVCI